MNETLYALNLLGTPLGFAMAGGWVTLRPGQQAGRRLSSSIRARRWRKHVDRRAGAGSTVAAP